MVCFAPWGQEGLILVMPPSIAVCNLTPNCDELMRKVSLDDHLAPFCRDKILAKSARILSAAITRTT